MASEQFEIIMTQVQRLSPEEQLELIKRVTESLNAGPQPAQPRFPAYGENGGETGEGRGLIYGKYRNTGRPESTEEDFRLAEWHPTGEEMNGN
jgi:hypothetical protein